VFSQSHTGHSPHTPLGILQQFASQFNFASLSLASLLVYLGIRLAVSLIVSSPLRFDGFASLCFSSDQLWPGLIDLWQIGIGGV